MLPNVFELKAWYEENKALLQPPVCNALPYGKDAEFQIMAIGGPNQRSEFHFEAHDEFFIQIRGKMVVRVVESLDEQERPTIRDVEIPEGGMFLLPKFTWHSPQRYADTFGLVVELKRSLGDIDRLRWWCQECRKPVHEVSVEQLHDLTSQIGPEIAKWRSDEAVRTCPHCQHVNEP